RRGARGRFWFGPPRGAEPWVRADAPLVEVELPGAGDHQPGPGRRSKRSVQSGGLVCGAAPEPRAFSDHQSLRNHRKPPETHPGPLAAGSRGKTSAAAGIGEGPSLPLPDLRGIHGRAGKGPDSETPGTMAAIGKAAGARGDPTALIFVGGGGF